MLLSRKFLRHFFPEKLGKHDFWLTLEYYKKILNKKLFYNSSWFCWLPWSILPINTQKLSHTNNVKPRYRNLCFAKHWFEVKKNYIL